MHRPARRQTIVSCLTLAGAEVTTIEGLAKGEELHPLQAAFIEHDAFQCGYCTPGQIVSGVACVSEGHAGSADEIRAWMSGNICRSGAFPGIVAAIADAAEGSPSASRRHAPSRLRSAPQRPAAATSPAVRRSSFSCVRRSNVPSASRHRRAADRGIRAEGPDLVIGALARMAEVAAHPDTLRLQSW